MNHPNPVSPEGAKAQRSRQSRSSIAPLRVCASLLVLLATTHGDEPRAAVSGVTGVKQDAVDRIKPIIKDVPPPPQSSSVHPVNNATPPPASNVPGAVGSAAKIQAVTGVGGIDAAKLRNLEIAIQIKDSAAAPAGSGAEKGGQGKAAAAALLSAPLQKPVPKIAPKEDGRAGFQEFEKLRSRGS